MHLHGRCLQFLLPKAVDDIDEYEYLDGELVAGIVIGLVIGLAGAGGWSQRFENWYIMRGAGAGGDR